MKPMIFLYRRPDSICKLIRGLYVCAKHDVSALNVGPYVLTTRTLEYL